MRILTRTAAVMSYEKYEELILYKSNYSNILHFHFYISESDQFHTVTIVFCRTNNVFQVERCKNIRLVYLIMKDILLSS
jgi:hypothetical protein